MDAAVPLTADEPLAISEDAFRAFYDRTARQLWAFLYHGTQDASLADDLLQETFYRLLRARRTFDSEAHQIHYIFRIAANLLTDAHRRARALVPLSGDERHEPSEVGGASNVEQRADLERALATLAPRDRDMLWLAYADGASHSEIAAHLGVRRESIKAMLFRARRRLAMRLRHASATLCGRGR